MRSILSENKEAVWERSGGHCECRGACWHHVPGACNSVLTLGFSTLYPSGLFGQTGNGYLAVCINPEFAKMVLGLDEDKTALARGDDTLALDRFKEMLREVGFRWTDGYFENEWTKLVEEAARRRQDLDEARKREETLR